MLKVVYEKPNSAPKHIPWAPTELEQGNVGIIPSGGYHGIWISQFLLVDHAKVKTLERLKSLVQEKQKCVEAEATWAWDLAVYGLIVCAKTHFLQVVFIRDK